MDINNPGQPIKLHREEVPHTFPTIENLAKAVLNLADTAEMPDTYWQTDWRITLAREVLHVPVDGRHTHAELWDAPPGWHGP